MNYPLPDTLDERFSAEARLLLLAVSGAACRLGGEHALELTEHPRHWCFECSRCRSEETHIHVEKATGGLS